MGLGNLIFSLITIVPIISGPRKIHPDYVPSLFCPRQATFQGWFPVSWIHSFPTTCPEMMGNAVLCTAMMPEDQQSHHMRMSQRSLNSSCPSPHPNPTSQVETVWTHVYLPSGSHSLRPVSLGLPHASLVHKLKKYQRYLPLSKIALVSVELVDGSVP